MSNGNGFSWLSFLLGLAIGLWISIVVLFLVDDDDDACCGAFGTQVINYTTADEAWIPSGDGDYYCTNNDEGGAIVIDEGAAIVVDEGPAIVVDEGGAIVVDEGSAIVVDNGGFVPAPGSDQLGRDRDFEEYRCTTNDEGGAIVVDRANRVAVTSMPESFESDRCVRSNGHAKVRNDVGKAVQVDEGGAIVVDEGAAIVVDAEADDGDDVELPDGSPESDTELAYCMVAEEGSAPIVIRAD